MTKTKQDDIAYCYTCIVAYKNNHLHAASGLEKAFVLFYHIPATSEAFVHRHLIDDLEVQRANGFIVDNDHRKHFLTLILNWPINCIFNTTLLSFNHYCDGLATHMYR